MNGARVVIIASCIAAVVGCAGLLPTSRNQGARPVSSPSPYSSPIMASPSLGPAVVVSAGPGGFIVPVGEAIEITAKASAAPPIWSILPDDQAKAELGQTLNAAGTTMTARVVVNRPGLLHLRANVGASRAEVELAGVDVPKVEKPTPLTVPLKVPNTLRLILTQADWQAFWEQARQADSTRALPSPPSVDFTQRSVVALVAVMTRGLGGPPVVTHVDGRDIHVAFSGEKEPHTSANGGPQPATVIQQIPRVGPDARFIVSGSLYRVPLPSNQEVLDIASTRSPRPSPSPVIPSRPSAQPSP